MGIKVAGIGGAVPGRNGVPGKSMSTEELARDILREPVEKVVRAEVDKEVRKKAKELHPVISFLAKHSSFVMKKFEKGIQKVIVIEFKKAFDKVYPEKVKKFSKAVERKTGIESRGLYTADTVEKIDINPTTALAFFATLNTINTVIDNKLKAGQTFSVDDIDGLICVSNTSDHIFPVEGKEIAKVLGIRPKFYANNKMACASVANALQTAATWLEKSDCKNVLIVSVDTTSRLKQLESFKTNEKNAVQNFLFGDGAACIFLEKTEGTGGIITSNFSLDVDAPDIYHRPHYTGDSEALYKEHLHCGDNNGENLNDFGYYESKIIAQMVIKFLNFRSGKLSPNDKIILPQASSVIIKGAFDILGEEIVEKIKPHLVDSALPTHAITGAPASLIAWWKGVASGQIEPGSSVTYFNSALGGVNGFITYDPTAPSVLSFYGSQTLSDSQPVKGSSVFSLSVTNGNGYMHENGTAAPDKVDNKIQLQKFKN